MKELEPKRARIAKLGNKNEHEHGEQGKRDQLKEFMQVQGNKKNLIHGNEDVNWDPDIFSEWSDSDHADDDQGIDAGDKPTTQLKPKCETNRFGSCTLI